MQSKKYRHVEASLLCTARELDSLGKAFRLTGNSEVSAQLCGLGEILAVVSKELMQAVEADEALDGMSIADRTAKAAKSVLDASASGEIDWQKVWSSVKVPPEVALRLALQLDRLAERDRECNE
jgi:hypothetical protein